MATHQQNEVYSSHNPTAACSKKKQVKFSKNLTSTGKKASLKKWRSTRATSVQPQPTSLVGKSTLATAPADNTFYYYYYYNTDTHQLPAINDEQQQVYNNIAGNYYYYTIDGTSDANYNDIFIQPAGNTENFNGQSWR